jgi:hypothetical protein
MATTFEKETRLVNGPPAAALLAGGIGSAVLGIVTTLAEASEGAAAAMRWSTAVGPLSGKVGITVIVYLIAWAVIHFAWRDKDVNFNQVATIAFILLAIGLLGTFPPVFELFAAE